MRALFDVELYILNLPIIISMRDQPPTSLFNSIFSNLTVIKIILFIVIILIVTNVVINVLIVPLLPLLLVLTVSFKVFHHLNHVLPMTGVTPIRIIMSAWIGWAKTVWDWAQSMDLALILTINLWEATKI